MHIGMMGVGDDGVTLYAPSGRRIVSVPKWLAIRIQRAQQWVAGKIVKYTE